MIARAILVVVVLARSATADCPARAPKTLPVARGAVVVDGVLDDETWRTACFADDFEQKQPTYGARPTYPVQVALAIAGDTLYVGARMWSAGPADVAYAVTPRDDTFQSDIFIFSIDPSHTKRIAYSFAVTAGGTRADWIHPDDNENKRERSWNPVWIGKAKILADGWSCEMAIPLSQLHLPRVPAKSWGIDFNWYVPGRNEDVFWRAVPLDRTAWASWFGELVDLPPVQPGLGLELLPYAMSRLVVDEVNPAPPTHHWLAGLEAGLDALLHPLPDLTVAATINPDFGQVEVDPAFVNLTAYEVTLPEKRPFFIENNTLFANAGGTYLYSRRIGGLPHALPTADAIDLPSQVRILGAIATGGYVAPQTHIAALGAVTAETTADAITAGRAQPIVVSPLTGWAAGRVEQQIGASVLAATATYVHRALSGTGLEAILPSSAAVAGGDARLRTDDGMYETYLYGGITALAGSAAAITAIEQDSTHYFQRPDQPHVHVDLDAHDLVGWHGGAIGRKRAGRWQGAAQLDLEAPGYDLNDAGMLASADHVTTTLDVQRLDVVPGKRLFTWDVGAGTLASWNFGGVRKPTDVRAYGDVMTTAYNTGSVMAHLFTPGDSDDLTRGGPRMHVGWASAVLAKASTFVSRPRVVSGQVELDASPTLQQGVIASLTLTDRVIPSLRLDITPSLSIVESHRQYVATVSDAGGGNATYGARYLFGHLARKDAAIELRATWSLTPELGITLYAQPFVSVGRYDAIGELTAAGSDQIRWYDQLAHAGGSREIVDGGTAFSIVEPDYRVASLRSTAVLRWELAPGSTLFIVWQQARGGSVTPAAQPLHSAAPDVLTQSAIHTLAVKLSYWFG